MQKNKLRPIDNVSASHVNATVGLQERFVVDAIDEIAGMVKRWIPGFEAGGTHFRFA